MISKVLNNTGIRFCGRPSNPVFCPIGEMRKQDIAACERWQAWVILQMYIVYRSPLATAPGSLKPMDQARWFFYALHDGMNHYSAGEAPPHEMPVIPAVWPDTFPFDIAWSFVEIINARAERFRSQQANGHS
ncbi:hypothetical protein F3X89_17370 [Rhizobium rhizogenes]|uniref:hypothetical protein n=1 Tax=Rhizobium rhizogenes TaxID=359 RepID=UPI00193DF2B5|nr:hypothetical protein [Rhizobium rhizogenes]QRM39465.1 hypothetical protein F3X89_17370 [Rhizobium rhizogenes]